MKLLQHSENLLMLFNGCDDDVRYVVVEPEYVKHHHRLIKDDEFVVWTFLSVPFRTRLTHTLHLRTTGLEHKCFGVKTTSFGAAVPFLPFNMWIGGGKGEKFKSSSIKLNFTSFLSSQNHLILTYTQEGHNSSKDLKILNNWLLRDWAAHLAKRMHTRKLHVCVNLIMFHVIIFRFSYFHDYGNMKVFIVFNGWRGNVKQIFDFNFSQFLMACSARKSIINLGRERKAWN